MPSINRLEPYTALSDVYQVAGYAAYSEALAPHLLDMAFELEWTGRSLLDLACGTGEVVCWFAEHGFRTVGVDSSTQMLRFGTARAESAGSNADFVAGDIRNFQASSQYELVTCLGGSLNYIPTLRDLESVFRLAQSAVSPGKLFIFDFYTIQGLASSGNKDQIVFDNGSDTMIVLRESFNYETLTSTRTYTILRYTDKTGWQRGEETHVLRGYPVQAVSTVLAKTGFKTISTLTSDLRPSENQRDAEQLLIVATREK
jgi:SAM-dependent methyltransferase